VTAATPSVYSGQNALYSISVSAEGGIADDVTVQIALPAGQTTSGLPDPVFNICNRGYGTQVCALDTMRENESNQIQAEVAVPSKSAGGGTVTLAATATAAAVGANSTGQVTDSASVDVNKSSTSTGHPGGGDGSGKGKTGSSGKGGSGSSSTGSGNGGGSSTTGDTQPFDNLPPLSAGDGSGSTGSGDSSNLFPTINPSSGSSGSSNGSQGTKAAHKPYKATTVADILPLNSGQLSGQVAGLIVLALGIVLVFARISLRKPRGAQTKE
jgi:hypothetical protein